MTTTIIGGGIGGLTTAICLEQKGLDYHVYEKFSAVKKIGAGIWLAPNALQVFESLGIIEAIKQNGNSIEHITIGKPDMTPILDNPQALIKAQFGYSAIAIHRATLQAILMDQIPESKIHLGKEFISYTEEDNKQVTVTFKDGSNVTSDYVIGADGINSRVRQQLFPESLQRYSGQTCWRGISEIELDQQYHHRVYELWGDQVRLGFSRITNGQYYWFAVAKDEANQKDVQGTTQGKLLDMFKNFHPVIIDIIRHTPSDQISRNDINDLTPMTHWYEDHICLIGDAGHATTPNMGQGGGQAIEDAYYLSHYMQQSIDNNHFQQFQQRRQTKVNGIVKQSWIMGKMAHWKYGTGLRNLILRSAPQKMMDKQVMELYKIDRF